MSRETEGVVRAPRPNGSDLFIIYARSLSRALLVNVAEKVWILSPVMDLQQEIVMISEDGTDRQPFSGLAICQLFTAGLSSGLLLSLIFPAPVFYSKHAERASRQAVIEGFFGILKSELLCCTSLSLRTNLSLDKRHTSLETKSHRIQENLMDFLL